MLAKNHQLSAFIVPLQERPNFFEVWPLAESSRPAPKGCAGFFTFLAGYAVVGAHLLCLIGLTTA
jgi:hypothetical protein